MWFRYTVSGLVAYKPRTATWSGPFIIHIKDQNGNVIFDDPGIMQGGRITVEIDTAFRNPNFPKPRQVEACPGLSLTWGK